MIGTGFMTTPIPGGPDTTDMMITEDTIPIPLQAIEGHITKISTIELVMFMEVTDLESAGDLMRGELIVHFNIVFIF